MTDRSIAAIEARIAIYRTLREGQDIRTSLALVEAMRGELKEDLRELFFQWGDPMNDDGTDYMTRIEAAFRAILELL